MDWSGDHSPQESAIEWSAGAQRMGATLFIEAADVVGESAVYDDQRGALLWVDIAGKRIHRVLLGDKRHEIWPAPDFPTSIGLRADGGAILGLRDRVVLWDYGGDFRTFAVIEPDLPDNRLNEGRVGPDGAFWVGTMQNNLHPDGSPRQCHAAAAQSIALTMTAM
jgi:sugar lactone lactonase YvrE